MSQTNVSEEEILTLPRVNLISGGGTYKNCRLRNCAIGFIRVYWPALRGSEKVWTECQFPADQTIIVFLDKSFPRSEENS